MVSSIRVQPVVMAGGNGTRLWPLSRTAFPKQFQALNGDGRSLFQQAVVRLQGMKLPGVDLAAPLCVTNDEHRFLVLDQLTECTDDIGRVLLEPCGRNTAPAMTFAALAAMQDGSDPVLVVTPSDHLIADDAAFERSIGAAVREAARGAIAILGIRPSRPETGYGYILAGDAVGHDGVAHAVARFVEKPDLARAQRYVADERYLWNSGMFVVRASVWLAALAAFRPDIEAATRAAYAHPATDGRFVRPDAAAFAAVPAESIDFAVMERCPGSAFELVVVALDAGWDDLGAWDAVWQVAEKDAQGNASTGDTLVRDSRDTLVHAGSRLVGVIGVEGLVVVETPDAVLVADRSRSQDVKDMVAELESRGRDEKNQHRKVHRPWGWYDSIDAGPRFQVKRIMVKPGASLSLQLHRHRAEHWVVVAGTAQVTIGERVTTLEENQSVYIPIGEKHRLANAGSTPLEIIEVQSGSYLGEDDIVRFDDAYGRG